MGCVMTYVEALEAAKAVKTKKGHTLHIQTFSERQR